MLITTISAITPPQTKPKTAATTKSGDPHKQPAKGTTPAQTKPTYNPDGIHLSMDRRKEMTMVVTATGKPLGYKTPQQEANYLKSLELAAPTSSYDPKGFLASLGLWGITGAGRGDKSLITAVKGTDYKPHTGPVPIPKFIMTAMVNESKTYHAVQGVVDPALSAYTNKRGLWKKPLVPAQTPKPTSVTPKDRYPQALAKLNAPSLEWGKDFHDGSGEGERGFGTFQIAMAAGFSDTQARRFSTTDYGVDLNKTPYGKTSPIVIGQMDRHFNFQRDGEDTRILWARQHLDLAIQYGRQGAFDEAEVELGVGMHSLQDLFAHGQATPSVHATLGHFVDDPDWSPVSMVESTVATRNYLKAYLQGISSTDGSFSIPPEPIK
ncbi:MAG: hypothetical protein H7338_06380 [Candidatus Sericytochromatia bacterium]|nr:hypothetical protein [Candidatus Sericytochromatia bacterium]